MRSFLLVLMLITLPQAAKAQESAEVLESLKSTYESIDALKADFSQTMSSEFMSGPQTTSGTLILRGDNYRVETGAQTIVTDGSVTWVFNPAENQLIINDYEVDETTFSISDFFFNFDEKYDVLGVRGETVSGVGHHVLELKPRDEGSFFTNVTLWVRKSDSIITKLQILDANETTMSFDLDGIELNPDVASDAFTFTPADDTDIVDLRS